MTLPKKHGGPRKGAGRPKGARGKKAKGRLAVTKSISMLQKCWDRLDDARKDQSRGKYISTKLLTQI
jgi:hypothetical protein